MQKIPTLFKKNPDNLALVINEVNPGNEWVFNGEGVATRKYDGTAAAIINGSLYKRYDVKKGKTVPHDAIACQEPDPITGHWPHWVRCDRRLPEDKYFFEAFDRRDTWIDGTYELCGPKVQGNPEKFKAHELLWHGDFHLNPERSWDGIRDYLTKHDIEGIVFHHSDGRMCKIRKADFGIKREVRVHA